MAGLMDQIGGTLFGGGSDNDPVQNRAQRQGLLQAGLGMLANSGPGKEPHTAMQDIAGGMMQGMQGYQQSLQNERRNQLMKQRGQYMESRQQQAQAQAQAQQRQQQDQQRIAQQILNGGQGGGRSQQGGEGQSSAGSPLGLTPRQIAAMDIANPDLNLAKLNNRLKPDTEIDNGAVVDMQTGQATPIQGNNQRRQQQAYADSLGQGMGENAAKQEEVTVQQGDALNHAGYEPGSSVKISQQQLQQLQNGGQGQQQSGGGGAPMPPMGPQKQAQQGQGQQPQQGQNRQLQQGQGQRSLPGVRLSSEGEEAQNKIQGAETDTAIDRYENNRKDMDKMRQSLDDTQSLLRKTRTMSEKGGTGPLAPFKAQVVNIADDVGIRPDEDTKEWANQIMDLTGRNRREVFSQLKNMGGGRITDRQIEEILKSVGDADNPDRANEMLISNLEASQHYELDRARAENRYIENNNTLKGFNEAWEDGEFGNPTSREEYDSVLRTKKGDDVEPVPKKLAEKAGIDPNKHGIVATPSSANSVRKEKPILVDLDDEGNVLGKSEDQSALFKQ